MNNKSKVLINVIIGLVIFFICSLLLPENLFSLEARLSLATISLMVFWWITRPVHIAITALIPIIVNSVFNIVPMASVLDDYFSPIVVLLLGANIIIACWINSGLDKRIALRALTIIGTSVKKQLIVWFILSTLLSMFLPNAVVVATLCPIAVAMIKFSSKDEGLLESKTMFLILLSIVWGAGLGGFGTPLGGAMNLVAINHIEKVTGQEYMYITWTLKMLPYLIILAAGTCIYLISIKTDTKKLPGSKKFFLNEYKKMGNAKKSELLSLVLFLIAVVLAFTRPLYQHIFPEFKPFYAFLLMGIVAFFLRDEHKQQLVSWNFAVKHINWGLMILFSGGLATGNLIISTGAADVIAQVVTTLNVESVFTIVLIFIVLGMFLSNASSNTAATAVLIPIVISIASAMALSPLPYIYIAAAACNCAFILPTSIRAIPIGYGLDVKFMFKKGLAAVAITLVLLTVAAFVNIAII